MDTTDLDWGVIHPSAFGRNTLAAEATPRAYGALRYQCPVMGSFVLLTDEQSLESITTRQTRLRCNACGKVHLLKCEEETPELVRN